MGSISSRWVCIPEELPLTLTAARSTTGPARARPRRVAPVGIMLLALAALPLLGAAWFAGRELDEVSRARVRAAEVGEDVQELVLSTDLPARLVDERNWMLAMAGIGDLGLSSDTVRALTGIDLDGQLTRAQAQVDELVESLGLTEVAQRLATMRSGDPSIEDLGLRYRALEDELTDQRNALFSGLLVTASDVGGGAEIVDALRVLDAAADARQAVSSQLATYFGTQFVSIGSDSLDDLAELTAQQAIYLRATDEIERIATPDSAAAAALAAVDESPDVQVFGQAVADLLATTFGDGQLPDSDTWPPSVAIDVDGIALVFEAAASSADVHLDLVSGAADDVTGATTRLQDAASADTRRAGATIAAMVLVSLAFAYALARFIGAPLRRLADTARQLNDGDAESRVSRPRGPREVRQATRAINEAAAHLALAERQANALANGDLDHPVLEESSPGRLGASLQEAVRTLASSLSEREEFRRRLAHEAAHDPLTQIPNRKACLVRLQRGLARTTRNRATLAVMFIDLDGFKEVNDHHGHKTGDVVLQKIATRLVNTVREGDHVGRLGGDEFLVIAEPVGGVEESVEVARRLLDVIAEPIRAESTSVSVDACIGIALAHETDLTADELLRDADLAVYKAKVLGRGRIELCDDALRAQMTRQADLELALGQAIAGDDLVLHYQPTIDPATGGLLGVEALVRWDRAGCGLVGPDEFIPVAERSELIVEIDRWVVQQVARQLRSWADGDGPLGAVPVSINVSGRHLGTDTFVANILEPLRAHDVDPSLVIVEVTESALLSDLPNAAARLQQLRDVGIRIAIDDFGTGYTSLAHLRTLPVDILKIDRTFTADSAARSLVKLIIDTGHLLGAHITAEGVETSDQAEVLTEMGSDGLQGFLYGRPCLPEDLSDQIHELTRSP